MKRTVLFSVTAAILAAAISFAQAPAPQAAGRGGRGSFGPPPELGPDDKQVFPDPPAGFNVQRNDIPHGQLTAVPYDSKTLGTRRRIGVYLPPGYSASRKYPTLYLIHGLGWNDLEWTAIRHVDVVLDNLIADGKIPPMVLIFPNGDSTMTLADIEGNAGGPRMNPGNAQHAAAGDGGAAAPAANGRQGMSMEPWLAPFENDLLKDIIPFVDSHYSVYNDRDHRARGGSRWAAARL